MTRGTIPKICSSILGALFVVLLLVIPATAEEESDLQSLQLFYDAKDLVVSVSRNPKPVSQTAENVTVLTAADIEMMGAHTLLDVLNNIPGIQTDDRGSVATYGAAYIQGALDFHTLYLLDGVRLNFLSGGNAETATISLQHVERIEIVKGPGSSSWGSALGAVVNIVTKSPDPDRKGGGAVSFSTGERGTRDTRGEASGTTGNLGYYLSAGHLASGGLHPNTAIDQNNIYGKLRWALPHGGDIVYTAAHTRGPIDNGRVDAFDLRINDHKRYFLSTLALNYPVNAATTVDVSLRRLTANTDSASTTLSTGTISNNNTAEEETTGGSGKVTWRWGTNALAAGGDFDHGKMKITGVSFFYDPDTATLTPSGENKIDGRTDRWGVFVNDTITFGTVAISPGVRYDHTPQTGSFTSPSLGIAWNPSEDTTLRAYAGRGFSLPVLLPGVVQERVVTVQAGLETTRIPYLWLKTTLFRNNLSDVQGYDADWNIILKKQRKQGVEVEVKTVPVFHTSLSAGYTFVDIRDRDTDKILKDVPRQIAKFGLHFEKDSLRSALLGRYVFWNASPDSGARDTAVIWDLNITKKVFTRNDTALELFFSGHNIFNGSQYSTWYFPGTPRWFEGGIRFEF